jgi:ABC-type transport system involved in cytochrome c biogenesis permease component
VGTKGLQVSAVTFMLGAFAFVFVVALAVSLTCHRISKALISENKGTSEAEFLPY